MKKVAIVTGGTRGIGRGIVIGLINAGYEVCFTYQFSEDAASKMQKEFAGRCQGYPVDSLDKASISDFAKLILSNKKPQLLVNNVGINHDKIFIEQEASDFWRIFEANLGSTIHFCKSFLPSMLDQRQGHIINISSVASIKPKVGNGAYGASKAAIERFSKTLALEVARFNVHVNCISPGFVRTDMFENFLKTQKKKDFYRAIPMRKVLEVEEVASAVVALCAGKINTTGSVLYMGNGENIL